MNVLLLYSGNTLLVGSVLYKKAIDIVPDPIYRDTRHVILTISNPGQIPARPIPHPIPRTSSPTQSVREREPAGLIIIHKLEACVMLLACFLAVFKGHIRYFLSSRHFVFWYIILALKTGATKNKVVG